MKLSVITINYNNCNGLKKTIESIRSQKDKNFEYIVIDGYSTDGSKKVLEENEDIITKYVSEKDKGIYDAMNKGVSRASGDYLLFVNSGDCLHDENTISKINKTSLLADINMAKVLNLTANGEGKLWSPPSESMLSLDFLRWNPLHHPGAIIKNTVQRKYPYNPDLKICSDRQFFIESLIIGDASYTTLDLIINNMEPQGASGTTGVIKMEEEDRIILNLLFTERQLRDINSSNYLLQCLTRPLTKYYGKSKFILRINKIIFKLMGIK